MRLEAAREREKTEMQSKLVSPDLLSFLVFHSQQRSSGQLTWLLLTSVVEAKVRDPLKSITLRSTFMGYLTIGLRARVFYEQL